MGNPRACAGAIKLARSNRVSDFSGRNESMGWLFSARFSSAPAGGPLSCPRCPCPAARGQSPGSAARARAPLPVVSRPDRRPRARGQSRPDRRPVAVAPLPVVSRPDRWPRGPCPAARGQSRPDRRPVAVPRCRGQSPGSAARGRGPAARGQSPGSAAPCPCPAARGQSPGSAARGRAPLPWSVARIGGPCPCPAAVVSRPDRRPRWPPPPRLLTVSEIGSWKFAQMPNRKAKRLGASSAKSQPL